MKFVIIALFIGLSAAEIITFIKVGNLLGLWPTIGIIMVTAIIGLSMLKSQGKETFYRALKNLQENRFPIEEVFDGLCLLIAGIFLLTPGFLTDVLGFCLLTPFLRAKLRQIIFQFTPFGRQIGKNSPTSGNPPNANDSNIIEGEYDDLTASNNQSDQ